MALVKGIRWIGIGLVAVVLAMIAAMFCMMLFQKDIAEAVASHLLGRDVNIAGSVDTDYARHLSLHATQVNVGNTRWARHEHLFETRAMTVSVDLLSLFRDGPAKVQLILDSPTFYLERSSNGMASWDLGASQNKRSSPPPIDVRLQMHDGRIIYLDHGRHTDLSVSIPHVEVHAGADTPLRINGTAEFRGQTFQLSASGGTLQRFYDDAHSFPFKLAVATGSTRFTAEGSVGKPMQLSGMHAHLSLHGESLRQLAASIGMRAPDQPFKLAAQLSGEKGKWALSDIAGYIGPSDIHGDAAVNMAGEKPLLEADVDINTLNVDLVRAFGVIQQADTTHPTDSGEDTMLSKLAAFDVNARLHVGKIIGTQVPLGPLKAQVNIDDNTVAIDPLHLAVADGAIDARVRLPVNAAVPSASINMQVDKMHLAPLLHAFIGKETLPELAEGTLGGSLNLDISEQGVDVAQGRLRYDAAAANTHVNVDLTRQRKAGEWTLQLLAKGTMRNAPLQATLTAQPLDVLTASDARWPLALQASIGKSSVNLQGTVIGAAHAFDLKIQAAGPGTKRLSALIGYALPPLPAYDITAEVQRNPDKLRIADVRARVGDSDFSGAAVFQHGEGKPLIAIDAKAKNLAYEDFDQLRTETNAQVDWMAKLNAANATVRIAATRVVAPKGVVFHNVFLDASLRDNVVQLEALRANGAGGDIAIHAKLDITGKKLRSGVFKADVRHVDLSEALKPFTLGDDVPGRLSANIDLRFGNDQKAEGTGEHIASTIQYDDRGAGNDLSFVLRQSAGGFSVHGSGSFLGEPFRLSGEAGSLAQAFSSARYPFDMRLHLLQTDVALRGSVRKPWELTGLQSTLVIAGPDPRKAAPLVGFYLPGLAPYRLEGKLSHHEGTWKFADVVGQVGDSDLEGKIIVRRGSGKPYVHAQLHSGRLDFDDFAGVAGALPDTRPDEKSSAAQQRTAAALSNRKTVLPDKKFSFDVLSDFDADLRYSADSINSDTLPLDRLSMTLSLKHGQMLLKPVLFGSGGGTLKADIRLVGHPGELPAQGTMHVAINKISLGALLSHSDLLDDSVGKINGWLSVQAQGQSVAQMLASVDGQGELTMSHGALDALVVELGGLDGGEALLLWLGKERLVRVRCAQVSAIADHGVVRFNRAVVDTTDTKFTMKGKIGFPHETLDLVVKAHPKDFSMFVARAPLLIEGSFKKPDFHPSWSSIFLRGAAGVLLGAITPPAALLALIEPGAGTNADCSKLEQ